MHGKTAEWYRVPINKIPCLFVQCNGLCRVIANGVGGFMITRFTNFTISIGSKTHLEMEFI